MYASKAACWVSSRTSPEVDAQTTAWYRARLAEVKAPASSVASTAKPFAAPRSRMARIAAGMESCRKPTVLEKTRTAKDAAWGTGTELTTATMTARVRAVVAATALTGPRAGRGRGSLARPSPSVGQDERLVGPVALETEERGVEGGGQDEADLEGDVTQRVVRACDVPDELLLVREQ